jgi:hypothetical protein
MFGRFIFAKFDGHVTISCPDLQPNPVGRTIDASAKAPLPFGKALFFA